MLTVSRCEERLTKEQGELLIGPCTVLEEVSQKSRRISAFHRATLCGRGNKHRVALNSIVLTGAEHNLTEVLDAAQRA